MHCSGIVKWDGRYVFLKPHQGKDGAERKSTRSPRSEVTHTWPSPPISIQRLICVWAAVCTKTPPRRGLRETWRFLASYPTRCAEALSALPTIGDLSHLARIEILSALAWN